MNVLTHDLPGPIAVTARHAEIAAQRARLGLALRALCTLVGFARMYLLLQDELRSLAALEAEKGNISDWVA